MPERCKDLPIDLDRGYPVPWFVEWIDGKPDFRVVSAGKIALAWKRQRCWICGGPAGKYRTFVAGPMCGINRTSSEPPSHRECATWAAKVCPFLTRPHAVRRENDLPVEERKSVGGEMILRNPGVTLLWTSKNPFVFWDGRGGFLFNMGDPSAIDWLCQGRPATREEALDSIETGLPALLEIAQSDPQPGAVEALLAARDEFLRHLPAPSRSASAEEVAP